MNKLSPVKGLTLAHCPPSSEITCILLFFKITCLQSTEKTFGEEGKYFIFQQDYATPHRANLTKNFLREQGIDVLPWPAQSPEDVWPYMKSRLNVDSHGALQTKDELIVQVAEERNNVPLTFIANLYQSIPKRLVQVVRAYGYLTKY